MNSPLRSPTAALWLSSSPQPHFTQTFFTSPQPYFTQTFFTSPQPYSAPNILHFSVALLHSECSSLLFITSLSLHIFFRTFVYLLHDAPASHSFSSRLTFSVLRVLLSSTCFYSSVCSTTKRNKNNIYMRAYNKESGDPAPLGKTLNLGTRCTVLFIKQKLRQMG